MEIKKTRYLNAIHYKYKNHRIYITKHIDASDGSEILRINSKRLLKMSKEDLDDVFRKGEHESLIRVNDNYVIMYK